MLVTEIADKKREKVVLTFGESTTTLQHHNFHYFSICVFRKLSLVLIVIPFALKIFFKMK